MRRQAYQLTLVATAMYVAMGSIGPALAHERMEY